MQLGTRWAAGSEPPTSVPAALRPAIAQVEADLSGSSSLPTGHWTLTWLEGRAIAELDTGWEVVQTASGEVIARPFED
jgi:hypothetical protein